MNSQENRSYSRIATHIKGWARKADPQEPGPLFRAGSLSRTQDQLPNLKDANLPDGLRSFLETLNAKLDILLSISGKKILQEDFPIALQIAELSAAGMKCLQPASRLDKGTELEVVLLLSQFPINMAGVMGRIQRIEKQQEQELLVVEFTQLRQADKENIVQFVFREQREQIRSLKDD